jgi:polar amino acid transport system permease protein
MNDTWFDWQFAWRILPDLMHAAVTTVGVTLAGYAAALLLGLVLALLRRSRRRWLSWPTGLIIEFVRSTPLLIQLYFLFYVAPDYGLVMPALLVGTLGIALHYACYVAEVYRAGLDGVPKGQWEAARVLSLSPWHAYLAIILPQTIRIIVPGLGNYLIAMFKDTPVLSAITVVELMLQAKNIGSASFRYIEPITLAGLFFLAVSLGAALLVGRLEGHLRMP